MIDGMYHKLFNETKEHVAQVRGIQIIGSIDMKQVCRVYH